MLYRDYPFNASNSNYENLYYNIVNNEPQYPKPKDEFDNNLIKQMLLKDPAKRITLKQIKVVLEKRKLGLPVKF